MQLGAWWTHFQLHPHPSFMKHFVTAYSHTTWLSFGKSCAYLNTEALHVFWISCIYDTVSLLLLVLEVGNFLVFCLYWGLYQWLVLGVGDWHNNQSQMHSSFNWSNLVQGVSSSTLSNQCTVNWNWTCPVTCGLLALSAFGLSTGISKELCIYQSTL